MNITTIDELLSNFYDNDDGTLGNRVVAQAEAKQALYDYLCSKLPEKRGFRGVLDDGVVVTDTEDGYNQALSDVESMLAKELGQPHD